MPAIACAMHLVVSPGLGDQAKGWRRGGREGRADEKEGGRDGRRAVVRVSCKPWMCSRSHDRPFLSCVCTSAVCWTRVLSCWVPRDVCAAAGHLACVVPP